MQSEITAYGGRRAHKTTAVQSGAVGVTERYVRDVPLPVASAPPAPGARRKFSNELDWAVQEVVVPTALALFSYVKLSESKIRNVVVLQSEFESVRQKHMLTSKRLAEEITGNGLSWVLYPNSHCRLSRVLAVEAQNTNTFRNTPEEGFAVRAYLAGVGRFSTALPEAIIKVVAVDDDERAAVSTLALQTKEYRKFQNIEVTTVYSIISEGCRLLIDESDLAAGIPTGNDTQIYPEYQSEEYIEEGRESGCVVEGVLQKCDRNMYYLLQEPRSSTLVTLSKYSCNRALPGDRVLVQVSDAEAEGKPDDDEEVRNDFLADEAIGDDFEDSERLADPLDIRADAPSAGGVRKGCVIKLLKTGVEEFAGYVEREESGSYKVKPILNHKALPVFRLVSRASLPTGAYVWCRRIEWTVSQRMPGAQFVRSFGLPTAPQTRSDVVLKSLGISRLEFTLGSLFQTLDLLWGKSPMSRPALKDWFTSCHSTATLWEPPAHARAGRAVCDQGLTFSIDPPGCRDIDDALTVFEAGRNTAVLKIHVADAAWFVGRGTAIDKEALERACTVYQSYRRLDMLPPPISWNAASLIQRKKRLAVTLVLTVEKKGDSSYSITSHRWERSVVVVDYNLTYQQATNLMNGCDKSESIPSPQDWKGVRDQRIPKAHASELRESLSLLDRILRDLARNKPEAKQTHAPEFSFTVNAHGFPTSIKAHVHSRVDELVEEAMYQYNRCAARAVWDFDPTHAIVRRLPPPNAADVAAATALLGALGLSGRWKEKTLLLDEIRQMVGDQKYMPALLAFVRSIYPTAQLVVPDGASSEADFKHRLLGALYMRLTSPLRRYEDLELQRRLLVAVGLAKPAPILRLTNADLELYSKRCAAAEAAKRYYNEWLFAFMMNDEVKKYTCESPPPRRLKCVVRRVDRNEITLYCDIYQMDLPVPLEARMCIGGIDYTYSVDLRNRRVLFSLYYNLGSDAFEEEFRIGVGTIVEAIVSYDLRSCTPSAAIVRVCPERTKAELAEEARQTLEVMARCTLTSDTVTHPSSLEAATYYCLNSQGRSEDDSLAALFAAEKDREVALWAAHCERVSRFGE